MVDEWVPASTRTLEEARAQLYAPVTAPRPEELAASGMTLEQYNAYVMAQRQASLAAMEVTAAEEARTSQFLAAGGYRVPQPGVSSGGVVAATAFTPEMAAAGRRPEEVVIERPIVLAAAPKVDFTASQEIVARGRELGMELEVGKPYAFERVEPRQAAFVSYLTTGEERGLAELGWYKKEGVWQPFPTGPTYRSYIWGLTPGERYDYAKGVLEIAPPAVKEVKEVVEARPYSSVTAGAMMGLRGEFVRPSAAVTTPGIIGEETRGIGAFAWTLQTSKGLPEFVPTPFGFVQPKAAYQQFFGGLERLAAEHGELARAAGAKPGTPEEYPAYGAPEAVAGFWGAQFGIYGVQVGMAAEPQYIKTITKAQVEPGKLVQLPEKTTFVGEAGKFELPEGTIVREIKTVSEARAQSLLGQPVRTEVGGTTFATTFPPEGVTTTATQEMIMGASGKITPAAGRGLLTPMGEGEFAYKGVSAVYPKTWTTGEGLFKEVAITQYEVPVGTRFVFTPIPRETTVFTGVQKGVAGGTEFISREAGVLTQPPMPLPEKLGSLVSAQPIEVAVPTGAGPGALTRLEQTQVMQALQRQAAVKALAATSQAAAGQAAVQAARATQQELMALGAAPRLAVVAKEIPKAVQAQLPRAVPVVALRVMPIEAPAVTIVSRVTPAIGIKEVQVPRVTPVEMPRVIPRITEATTTLPRAIPVTTPVAITVPKAVSVTVPRVAPREVQVTVPRAAQPTPVAPVPTAPTVPPLPIRPLGALPQGKTSELMGPRISFPKFRVPRFKVLSTRQAPLADLASLTVTEARLKGLPATHPSVRVAKRWVKKTFGFKVPTYEMLKGKVKM